jgi:polyhydroxybutyrate depolymerase
MRKVFSLVLGSVTLTIAACSSSSPTDSSAAAGASAAGSPATGGGGATAVAGAGGSASGAGGGAVTAGASGSAGTSSGGGAGGVATGGSGGMSGGQGGGGGAGGGHTVKQSAGCGKLNPAKGARTIMTGGQSAMFNVNLPANYDATKPLPLGFGFHGFGNQACGPTGGECQGFAALPAVTVYMKSISDGWEQAAVLEQNVKYWQDVLALMKDEYCIDENRVFIAGVSSGGQFIEHLTCRFGDTLWQTTAVSAAVVGAADKNCKGTPPVLVIHGVTDMAGNFGQDTAAMFAKRNGCSATPPAGLEKAKTDLMTAFNAKKDEHVCLDYDACTANPVRFCISSQITYSGLTHGWPKIGGMLISDFQSTIK